jgi:hypothetical protein
LVTFGCSIYVLYHPLQTFFYFKRLEVQSAAGHRQAVWGLVLCGTHKTMTAIPKGYKAVSFSSGIVLGNQVLRFSESVLTGDEERAIIAQAYPRQFLA